MKLEMWKVELQRTSEYFFEHIQSLFKNTPQLVFAAKISELLLQLHNSYLKQAC